MFQESTIDAIVSEAEAAGVRGATAISVAVRQALMGRKASVPDGRNRTYWARLEWDGECSDWLEVSGFADLTTHITAAGYTFTPSMASAARAGLTRKAGEHTVFVGDAVLTIRNTRPE